MCSSKTVAASNSNNTAAQPNVAAQSVPVSCLSLLGFVLIGGRAGIYIVVDIVVDIGELIAVKCCGGSTTKKTAKKARDRINTHNYIINAAKKKDLKVCTVLSRMETG